MLGSEVRSWQCRDIPLSSSMNLDERAVRFRLRRNDRSDLRADRAIFRHLLSLQDETRCFV
jgi:hypothetical protein